MSIPTGPAPLGMRRLRVGLRVVLDVDGELEIATAPALVAATESTLEEAAFEIWIDHTRVTFLDSAGIHALETINRRVAEKGRRLAIVCPSGPARRTLTLTQADRTLPVFASRHHAHRA